MDAIKVKMDGLTEQINKMSKSDDRDIYGEKRTRGTFGSNLLDN